MTAKTVPLLCMILTLLAPGGIAAAPTNPTNPAYSANSAALRSSNRVVSTKIALSEASSKADAAFSSLADKFFESLFRRDPDMATTLGIHDNDNLAPDLSATGVAERCSELKSFLKQFEEMKSTALSAQSKIDIQLIISNIKGKLLTYDELREWERNPDMYSSQASSMIYDLMNRNFAPLAARLKSVIAREKKIPEILRAAKSNLKNPPKIYTEIAIDQVGGGIEFFEKSVPDTFKSVEDKALMDEFKKTNNEVIAQLKDYEKFLKDDLLAKSKGNFALGADIYAKKLLYDEMEDTPVDKLLADGEKELRRVQAEFVKTAKEIDPNKSATEVFRSISLEHPAPDKLLESTSAMLKKLRDYCVDKNIVTMPTEGDLRVEATPSFMRALTFASMSSLGPFEKSTKESYYFVTVPEASWTAEQKEQHMRSYGKYSLMDTSVHEVFPGHYVQGLFVENAPSKTTKIIGCNSNIEGWAHYCEQMMVEQGLEDGSKKLKLAMLHKALRRCCRYIVAIRMHTKGMTTDEAVSFFMNESYEEKANAERETKRGTIDPTYLVYTLGKLQIMALRNDYKNEKGNSFTIKDFHDRFLSTGCPPVKLIRGIMLGN